MYTKFLLVAAGIGLAAVLMRGKSDIDPAKAKALVEAGAKLVDVRTPGEYQAGHIDGAVNIPVGDLSERMDEIGPKSDPVVVYCRSGNRSGKAQGMLKAAGFVEVHNLGPMSAWK